MKKIVYVLSLLFMITACNGDNTTFENNAYKLRNAKNGAEITLGFDGKDKRFFGRSAINRYFGTYKTEGDRLTFGPAGSTMMAGPGHLMAAEREYMQFLPQVATYRLDGNRLILSKANGESMVFERTGIASSLE